MLGEIRVSNPVIRAGKRYALSGPVLTAILLLLFSADGLAQWVQRDPDFGRIIITSTNERGLYELSGYAAAQDRLWQLELFRRTAKGELAEIFGPIALIADKAARRESYTLQEYQAMFDGLPGNFKLMLTAYTNGVNRFLREAAAASDQTTMIPWEFYRLGYRPQPWQVTDSMAIIQWMTRRFGENGFGELANLALLQFLTEKFGPQEGRSIFNDLRWINDPEAPVTVPHGDPGSRPLYLTPRIGQAKAPQRMLVEPFNYSTFPDVRAAAADAEVERQEVDAYLASLGIPLKFGSYAYVVNGEKSATGKPILYGGPQMGFVFPDIIYEANLRTIVTPFNLDTPKINVTGITFSGAPGVLIGHTDRIAWTSTTGIGDNIDTYIEKARRHPTEPDNFQYLFNGQWRDMEKRTEVFKVRSSPMGAPLQTTEERDTFYRTIHGPLFLPVDVSNGVAYSSRRSHWKREFETAMGFIKFMQAKNLSEFEEGIKSMITSHNFLYADVDGNIAYWQAGQQPIRPRGFDIRLPLPGTGEAEWEAGFEPVPRSINPRQGFLANWNNKPAIWFDNWGRDLFGKQFRVKRILELLDDPTQIFERPEGGDPKKLSVEDFKAIERDTSRLDGLGLRKQFLMPYIDAALSSVAAVDARAGRLASAQQILDTWSGYVIGHAITSESTEVGEVIFDAWLRRMLDNVFRDKLGAFRNEATINTLIHLLDGPRSGVPPSRDYFNGKDWREIAVDSMWQALNALKEEFHTEDMSAWRRPRLAQRFLHSLGLFVGPDIPNSNRSTYAQIVHLSTPVEGISAIPSGNSGFLRFDPSDPQSPIPDPHALDQRMMFRNFQFKRTLIPGDKR